MRTVISIFALSAIATLNTGCTSNFSNDSKDMAKNIIGTYRHISTNVNNAYVEATYNNLNIQVVIGSDNEITYIDNEISSPPVVTYGKYQIMDDSTIIITWKQTGEAGSLPTNFKIKNNKIYFNSYGSHDGGIHIISRKSIMEKE